MTRRPILVAYITTVDDGYVVVHHAFTEKYEQADDETKSDWLGLLADHFESESAKLLAADF